MKPPSTRLHVTPLEARVQPATFGQPWAGPQHLTISFVPDGTLVDGQPSALFGRLEGLGLSRLTWQTEVLRAFQTWSEAAGVSLAVVPDSGDPLGTSGFAQGDSRFGDIRVAARPLSRSVLAITTPPGVVGDSRSGDIVLNTSVLFGLGDNTDGLGRYASFDLYSAVLQESGHSLGVGNSADPASPMYEQYRGRRGGLSGGDVAQLRALYGPRAADPLEGNKGNQTVALATKLTPAKPQRGATPANLAVAADLGSAADADTYRFTTPANANLAAGLTVRVQSRGQSLVAARVTVTDAAGRPLGTAVTAGGVADVRLAAVAPQATYFVRVEADAAQPFKVGKYKLKLLFNAAAPDADAAPTDAVLDDAGTNETLKTATALSPTDGYADDSRYAATAVLRTAADVDVYRIDAPKVGKAEANVGTVTITTLEAGGRPPVVEVWDEKSRPVSVQVVANGGGAYTVQFSGARSEGKYYLRVSAGGRGGAAAGLYQLDAGFRRQLVSAADYAAGTLTAAAPAQYQQLDIARSQLQNFVLSASSGAGGNEAVRMTIYDEAGLAVVSLFAASGDTVSTTAYLAPGRYTVAFFGGTPSGLALDALTYSLRGGVLSDPIGSGLVDSGGNSVPVLPPPPPPGPGQPPPDYTWQSPAPTTLVAQRLFAWVNPWAL